MKTIEKSILISLVICLFATLFFDNANSAKNIRRNTLRLHIIADDNSAAAQEIKIKVKEELVKKLPEVYFDARDCNAAVEATNSNLDFIENIANNTLRQNNADYTASCRVEDFYFDTTVYEGFTMPRGNYKALTVRLGRAEGKNWWCVAYPGLCLSSRAKYEDERSNTFIETDNLRIKFKAVELWEDIKSVFKDREKEYSNY